MEPEHREVKSEAVDVAWFDHVRDLDWLGDEFANIKRTGQALGELPISRDSRWEVYHVRDRGASLYSELWNNEQANVALNYKFVAEVEAQDADEVLALTSNPDNLLGEAIRIMRVGDLVVDPRGRGYRLSTAGWNQVAVVK